MTNSFEVFVFCIFNFVEVDFSSIIECGGFLKETPALEFLCSQFINIFWTFCSTKYTIQ